MPGLGEVDRSCLLKTAREALRAAVQGRGFVRPPHRPPALEEPRACFVTLHLDGALRGCIGSLTPRGPLLEAVQRNARAAALEDPRFPPLSAEEEPRVRLEVSVLGPCEPLEHRTPEELLARLRPGRDGVILRQGAHQATFLPQVWAQLPDPESFLEHLSRKAGCPGLWRQADAEILTYQAESFEE